MPLSDNKNTREMQRFAETTQAETAVRVTHDPANSATFNLKVLLAQGNDLTSFMVNDFNEILFNDSGSLLTE